MHSEHLTNISIDNLTVFSCAHYINTVGTAVFSVFLTQLINTFLSVGHETSASRANKYYGVICFEYNSQWTNHSGGGTAVMAITRFPAAYKSETYSMVLCHTKKKNPGYQKYYYKMIQNTYQKNKNCNKMINSNQILLALILK